MSTTELSPVPLTLAGQRANQAAAGHLFADYRSRKSDHTLRTQATALGRFARYLAAAGVSGLSADTLLQRPAAWRGITWGPVEGFVKWLLNQGYAIATVNNRLSAVKTYARLAAKAGAISAGELQLIRAVSGYGSQEGKRIDESRPHTRRGRKKATPVRLSPQQAQQLKSHPFTPQGRRDTLLMCLLPDHGLRAGEVARLQVSDFDLEAGQLRFYRAKVHKEQTHRLSADTLRAAQAYFQMGDAPDEGGVLRASRKGGALLDHALSERAISGRVRTLRPPAAGP